MRTRDVGDDQGETRRKRLWHNAAAYLTSQARILRRHNYSLRVVSYLFNGAQHPR